MSAMQDAITQNTPGDSQGNPEGVPTSYSWYSGTDTVYGNTPPSNFSAVTGWGIVYPAVGSSATANANANVQIQNFTTWLLLDTGQWVEAQNQSTDPISGAHFVADFSGNASVPWTETTSSDGTVTVDAPQSGYNDHFFPSSRGTYTPGTVVGVFVEANMRTTSSSADLVASLGADWWENATAPYVNGFANNPGAGESNWVKLSTQWQTLYFSSLSPQALEADPPPPLQGSTTTTQPAITSIEDSPSTGTVGVGQTVTLTLAMNEAVTVQNGTPTLTLNDGGTATYTGGSGTNALTFTYTVAAGQSTSALAATGVNLNGATIQDASGNTASLSLTGLSQSGPQIGGATAKTPAVTSVSDSPSSGTVGAGQQVTLTLGMNEAVTVQNGTPTLTLNDGGTATYTGGSGTNALTFTYTVAAGQSTSALAATGVNLNGATIQDASGNTASLSLSGLNQAGPQINGADPDPQPTVSSIADTPSSGTVGVGQKVTLTLGMSEAVTVQNGTPTLTLNDGGTATYTGGSGTDQLTFAYTVGAGQNTSSLAAVGVNLNGASIQDSSGNAASLSLASVTQNGPKISTATDQSGSDFGWISRASSELSALWHQYMAGGVGSASPSGQATTAPTQTQSAQDAQQLLTPHSS